MCIDKVPRNSVEFLTPATTDNVESAKNFKLWTELNFWKGVELFTAILHWYRHAESQVISAEPAA
jgi:hypothetical protein